MSDSIWKKEIRLGKPKQPKAEQPKTEQPEAPRAEKTSVWKKEIRLGGAKQPKPPKQKKQKKQKQAKLPAAAVSPSVQAAELVHEAAPPPLAAAAHQRPRGTVVVPVVPEQSDAVRRLQRWSERVPTSHAQFPRPAVETPAPVPVVPLPPAPETAADVEPAQAAEPHELPRAPLFAQRYTERAAEPVETASENRLHEAPAPAPEPAKQEKVPLLKREIHLGRKQKAPKPPKAEKPKRVKEPKPPKEPKAAKAPKVKKEKPPKGERVPLLKREINFSRNAKAPKGARAKADAHKVVNVVGLRVGSSQIAAAHVRNNGSAEVLQLASAAIERGLVVGGEVREPVALTKALKSFFAENKLPRKDIRLGIASNRIGVRLVDVPAVDDAKQFENAVRFRAQESLPIPVADAVLDHVVLGEEPGPEGELVRRVLVVFAHRELVSRYVDVCRQAGLRLVGIDLDAFALLRAIVPPRDPGSQGAAVAVSVGHERTVFAVSDGGVCDFTRVLEWGSGAIDVAIARALDLAPSQAGPIKHALDLDAVEPPAGLSPMQFEAARAAVKSEIGQLVRELLSSLRFYQSRPGTPDISEIVLSGGGVQLAGFAEEVQRGLGAPLRVADPFGNVTLAKKVAVPEDASSLAIAVGLGIQA